MNEVSFVNVLLIDDHPLVNMGLAALLNETGRFSVLGQAHSLGEAQRFVEDSQSLPSLIILDIQLGKENGLDFIPFLRKTCQVKHAPLPPVLVCSAFDDPFLIQRALNLGAHGYVSKNGNRDDLLDAVNAVAQGKSYVSGGYNKLEEISGKYSLLTRRELDVLQLIKQNKNNQQIATIMDVSKRTVENHISNIYFKTKTNREGLVNL